VVAINLWFFDHPEFSGLFNLGTGRAEPFNTVALSVIRSLTAPAGAAIASAKDAFKLGHLSYVPFPEALVGKYQCFTQADMQWMQRLGCSHQFSDVSTGVSRYMQWLSSRV
jgi:ADP-L-glycero-D-manno-heptose 6-epimerase